MRVLHSSFEFPPQSTGGLGTYLNDLIHYQRTYGDDVILAFHGIGEIEQLGETIRVPSFGSRGELLTYPATDYGDVDLLVAHDWQGLAATSALWRDGVPFVYTCHLPLRWDVGEYSDVPCGQDRELEFVGLLRADVVICVSAAVEDHLHQQYPFTRRKTVICPNGTDTEFFSPAEPPVHDSRVLFLGRYCEQKGFDLLPDIIRRVWARRPETHLEIMGTGPLEDEVREAFGGDNRVEWRPFGNLGEVRDAYRRATVVLMPSRLEPFGLVAIEAMASGRPLVATATGGLADIVTDRENGVLVDVVNPECYASALLSLIDDPDFCRSIGEAARAHAVQTYNIQRRMQAVRDVYAASMRGNCAPA